MSHALIFVVFFFLGFDMLHNIRCKIYDEVFKHYV